MQLRNAILVFCIGLLLVSAATSVSGHEVASQSSHSDQLAAADETLPSDALLLHPGDDVQATVDAAPKGATIIFAPGLYREVTIHPKDGQTFIGQGDVVLSGARLFTGWVQKGKYWRLDGLPPALGFDLRERTWQRLAEHHVIAREMLFLGGVLLQPAKSLADLRPGMWFRDDDSAVIAEPPGNRPTEVAVTGEGFASPRPVDNVTIRNLTLEKYATAARRGAIHGRVNNNMPMNGWRIENVTARYNHGAGLVTGADFVVLGGHFTHNGQAGILNHGDHYHIEGTEIAYNNILGYFPNWEAGGFKTRNSKDGVLRANDVHHNYGRGIWTDGSETNPTTIGNYVHDNDGAGIYYELTFGGRIEKNRVERNGRKANKWKTADPNIYINQSSNVVVTDNDIVVAADGYGKGIILQQRRRGDGRWRTTGVRVVDNRITYEGDVGHSGWWIDDADEWYKDNLFDGNTYFGSRSSNRFMVDGDFAGLEAFRRAGQEANGTWGN